MNALSDESLMNQVKAGELGLAGLLFERYQRPIHGFLWRTLDDRHAAEDATQAVFLRLLKYRRSYREGRSFKTWLYSIAVNVRNQTLSERIRQTRSVALSALDEPSTSEDGEAVALGHESRAALHAALSRLPDDRRELLALYLWQELDYSQLAELYGVSTGSLRVRMHRALAALREALNPENGDHEH